MATHAARAAGPKYPPRVRRAQAAALDLYLDLEEQAKELSEEKCSARDAVIALAEHGDIVVASDGRSREVIDIQKATNQHEKALKFLVAQFGISPADVKAAYEATFGSKHDRDLRKK